MLLYAQKFLNVISNLFRYSWSKDDKLITDLSEISASMLVNVGTLIIEKPEKEKHAGYYQCAAENSYGKALSVRTLLKEVSKYHLPMCGERLTCCLIDNGPFFGS